MGEVVEKIFPEKKKKKNPGPNFARKNIQDEGKCYNTLSKKLNKKTSPGLRLHKNQMVGPLPFVPY